LGKKKIGSSLKEEGAFKNKKKSRRGKKGDDPIVSDSEGDPSLALLGAGG